MELTIETPSHTLETSPATHSRDNLPLRLPSVAKLATACLVASALGAALVITAENTFKIEDHQFVPKPQRILNRSPQLIQTTGANSTQKSSALSNQALYLVRSTLLALDQANRTGNYSVLRALGTPQFSARNSAADLAIIFSNLRRKKIDLAAVALIYPRWQPPTQTINSGLRLRGVLPMNPGELNFDMQFRPITGMWKIYALSVSFQPAKGAKPAIKVKKQGQGPGRAALSENKNSKDSATRAANQPSNQNRG